MKIVVTTYDPRLKAIILDLETGARKKIPRESSEDGRCFGMTFHNGRIYMAVNNSIVSYNSNFEDARTEFTDDLGSFHQILSHDNMLWITSTTTNGIYCGKHYFGLNPLSLRLIHRRPRMERYDINHINSIYINEDNLYLACHNRKEPSFILKYSYPDLFLEDRITMGKCIHNLLVGQHRIWTLDSAGSRAIISNRGDKIKLGGKTHFLRGMCATKDWFIVGRFRFNSIKERRFEGHSEVLMVSRKTYKIEQNFILRNTGEINDIRLLDVYDECHGVEPLWS